MRREAMEAFAADYGIPALLDHLGLDGLANEVTAERALADRLAAEVKWWCREYGSESEALAAYDEARKEQAG